MWSLGLGEWWCSALCFFKCAFFHCLCWLEPLSPSVFTYPVFACVAYSVVFIHSDKRRACKIEIKCKTTLAPQYVSYVWILVYLKISLDTSASKFPVTYNDINVYTNLSTNSTWVLSTLKSSFWLKIDYWFLLFCTCDHVTVNTLSKYS